MKIRNISAHAIQLMYRVESPDDQPIFDFVHLPPAMENGYAVIEDEIWNILKELTLKAQVTKTGVEVLGGITLDNKPVSQVKQVPTGETKVINVIQNYIKEGKLEYVIEESGSDRLPAELKMIEDLHDLGFPVAADIDSGKLAKLHGRIFNKEDVAVLKPTTAAISTAPAAK